MKILFMLLSCMLLYCDTRRSYIYYKFIQTADYLSYSLLTFFNNLPLFPNGSFQYFTVFYN